MWLHSFEYDAVILGVLPLLGTCSLFLCFNYMYTEFASVGTGVTVIYSMYLGILFVPMMAKNLSLHAIAEVEGHKAAGRAISLKDTRPAHAFWGTVMFWVVAYETDMVGDGERALLCLLFINQVLIIKEMFHVLRFFSHQTPQARSLLSLHFLDEVTVILIILPSFITVTAARTAPVVTPLVAGGLVLPTTPIWPLLPPVTILQYTCVTYIVIHGFAMLLGTGEVVWGRMVLVGTVAMVQYFCFHLLPNARAPALVRFMLQDSQCTLIQVIMGLHAVEPPWKLSPRMTRAPYVTSLVVVTSFLLAAYKYTTTYELGLLPLCMLWLWHAVHRMWLAYGPSTLFLWPSHGPVASE